MILAAERHPKAAFTAEAAARAMIWLAEAWTCREEHDAGIAVEVLALSQICKLLCGTEIADDLTEAVCRVVPEPAWAASSLMTSLIAAIGALRDNNAAAASAEQYLCLLGQSAADGISDVNVTLVRLALNGPARAAKPRVPPPDLLALNGGARLAQKLASKIEISTEFGTAPVKWPPSSSILLEGAAIAAFRAYDLPLAMRLLRASRYIGGWSSAATAASVEHLQLSFCDDGSFGDYDTALAQMTARGYRAGLLAAQAADYAASALDDR